MDELIVSDGRIQLSGQADTAARFLLIGALWAVLVAVLGPRTTRDHRPIRDIGRARIHSRPKRWTRRGIIPGSRIPASSCGRVQSRTATRPAGVTVARCCAPRLRQHRPTEPAHHDAVAYVIRRLSGADRQGTPEAATPGATGWSNPMGPRPRRRVRRHLPTLLLLLPLVTGLLSAPASSTTVSADELSDAKAKQAALKERVAKQKAEISAINDLQHGLAAEIADTKNQLAKVGADLNAVRKKISRMQAKINQVKSRMAKRG